MGSDEPTSAGRRLRCARRSVLRPGRPFHAAAPGAATRHGRTRPKRASSRAPRSPVRPGAGWRRLRPDARRSPGDRPPLAEHHHGPAEPLPPGGRPRYEQRPHGCPNGACGRVGPWPRTDRAAPRRADPMPSLDRDLGAGGRLLRLTRPVGPGRQAATRSPRGGPPHRQVRHRDRADSSWAPVLGTQQTTSRRRAGQEYAGRSIAASSPATRSCRSTLPSSRWSPAPQTAAPPGC